MAVEDNKLSDKAKNDIVLVEEVKKGDDKSFSILMKRYRDSIYYMLLKMVNNPVDAEDLTMEAFGKAYKNIDTYTPTHAFSTWLFMIATNNCIDFIRKKQITPTMVDQMDNDIDTISQSLQSGSPDPEETLINEQEFAKLRKIVSTLKEPYKTIIELRYFKEYSYEEIASEMQIPIGTVKIQLHRAKALLYNILYKDNKN
ncbi:MAG: sigma-70 family RNA polymerase sigma factor [Bacteroidales bacterium]|nr:sigma-70 family RNA polymerase sigma factor [Bacteroidales bacterium]